MRRSSTVRTTTREADVDLPLEHVWAVVASGETGPQWYVDAAPLRFRGAIDRLAGGRHPAPPPGRPFLATGDRAGFWEVLDADAATHRLVLEARVRAPGTVRLSTTVTAVDTGTRLTQQVTLAPRGPAGVAYLVVDLPARGVVAELTMLHLLTVLRRAGGRTPVS